MLHISHSTAGKMELGGSLTRQNEQDASLDPTLPNPHVANIGRYIEEQELKMRSALQVCVCMAFLILVIDWAWPLHIGGLPTQNQRYCE